MLLNQSTQFVVKELTLITEYGSFDITSIIDELNIFDNMFFPCMSGSVLLADSINLSEKLKFDGNEFIKMKISKSDDAPETFFEFEKLFRIYKIGNKTNLNQTTKVYVLNFVSEEYLFSEQQKVAQSFSGKYSNVVLNVLTNYLKLSTSSTNGKSKIGTIIESNGGQHTYIAPTITPFGVIDQITKRAVSKNNKPDFIFFENSDGYHFVPLSRLISQQPIYEVNCQPKNIEEGLKDELLGVRRFKVLTQSNVAENIKNGSLAGRFVGFDTLTRNIQTLNYTPDKIYGSSFTDKNIELNNTNGLGKTPDRMLDSRIVTHPFSLPRTKSEYVEKNNLVMSHVIDNTHEYTFHRRALIGNLAQKRIKLVLPGNFGLKAGITINVLMPKYSIDDNADDSGLDRTLSGKYIVLATRHIIRPDKHETIVEVATTFAGK